MIELARSGIRAMVGCGFMLCIGASSGAWAADAGEPAPVAETSGWQGAYVGGHIGYDGFRTSNSADTNPSQSWDQDDDGWLGGVLLGYTFELGDFAIGVEADAGFGKASDTERRAGLDEVRITDHGQHTFRVRAGLPTPLGLAYVTGGLALSDIWVRSSAGDDENFHLGYVVGGGLEHKITRRISVRAEYLFTRFGEEDYDLGGTTLESEFDSHRARVGVAWYFW